jgi:hypothetical protein
MSELMKTETASSQLVPSNRVFKIVPTSVEEAIKLAEFIANSDLAPANYKGKTANVLIAMQMGGELNLSPMQAIQNIAVINGRPCLWGDSLAALAKNHPAYEYMNEYFQGEGDNLTAVCEIKRQGATVQTIKFSVQDAKTARLWGKSGPWTQYPKRMLQMRARGFAIRNVFADAICGMQMAEEVRDLKVIPNSNDAAELIAQEVCRVDDDVLDAPGETLADRLEIAIELYKLPTEVVTKWLDRANVSKLNELSDEQLQKCLDYILEKFQGGEGEII